MIKGTNFEKELDAYFDKMEALGMSEEDILKQMMGGAQNKDMVDKGQAIEFDVTDIKMDQQLFKEFDKVMKSHGVDKELQKVDQHFQQVQTILNNLSTKSSAEGGQS